MNKLKNSIDIKGLSFPVFFACLICWLILPAVAVAAETIVPGQQISIMVPGHPEFSSTVIVGTDGTTDYPLLAGISLSGLTASEVRSLLLPLLMRYESEPDVFVVASQKQVLRLQIYGAVEKPGNYEAIAPLNLQQLLAMANGWTDEANLSSVQLLRAKYEQQTERVIDLTMLFHADSLAITPYLEDGDMVIVPRLTTRTAVRVYGSVQHPGEVYVGEKENLYEIIMRTGGFLIGADTRRVRILSIDGRISSDKTFDIFTAIEQGKIDELPMMSPGDIVIVPVIPDWRKPSWWITWIRDLSILASSLVVLNQAL